MKAFNPVFSGLPTTIFTVMSALAREHDAINLGQGFPDVDGPEFVRRAAADAVLHGPNQYPPSHGLPELRRAVAEHDRRHYGLDYDPEDEVIVTSGATEALADSFLALLRPDDEAVLIEPVYDAYAPLVRSAGAVPRFVQLKPPDWLLDEQELRAAFNSRTKLIAINTPMNPTGKVFTRSELDLIAALLDEYDCYAICDEVYEHLTFGAHRHLPLAALPGMRARCARIGSAGKSFSLTGWKVGYVCADRPLCAAIAKTHQFVTFTTAPALQVGVAAGLRDGDGWVAEQARKLEAARDLLCAGLAQIGFDMLPCQGTYFVNADFRALDPAAGDAEFCRRLAAGARVVAIPLSAFYEPGSGEFPRGIARFCFCKEPALLNEALCRLREYLR